MIDSLVSSVQRNCDIADARYGTDFTMCVYLMKMREYFRWEQGFGFRDPLPKEALGDWLSIRESRWLDLDDEDFSPIVVNGNSFDPFDAAAINDAISPRGLVYSSGLEGCAKPHFYLGELEHEEASDDGFLVRVSGRELARGLSAPAAMQRENTIFLRREALARLLWERLETWRWSSPDNAMGRAFGCYDFDSDVDAALDAMVDAELDIVRQHEIGEYIAGESLGDTWNEMLMQISHTPAEIMARAVRDLFADCTSTLPFLIDQQRDNSIHFYVGNLTGMRKEIFPSMQKAYENWIRSTDKSPLAELAERGAEHWKVVAETMCTVFHANPGRAAKQIEELVMDSRI